MTARALLAVLAAFAIVVAGGDAAAQPTRPRLVRGQDIERLPTRRRVIALTFDAGSDAGGTYLILRTLERAHAAATFFVTGRWVKRYPRQARAVAARFPVGNHTYDHIPLVGLATSRVRAEIVSAAREIQRVTGQDPRPLFRFPYGARDARTIAIVNRLGYDAIRWTIDSLGWEGTSGGRSVSSVVSRVLANASRGAIVLMHVGAGRDRAMLDARALASIVRGLSERGYRFVTLTDYFAR